MGVKIMKRLPKNKPARYIFEYVDDKKEYRCKKKFRFVVNGTRKDTSTKWHWTIEECEDEAKRIIQLAEKEGVAKNSKQCLRDVLTLYKDELHDLVRKLRDYKSTSYISKYEQASGLLLHTKPELSNKKIIDLNSKDFRAWMNYINSEDVNLSGKRVRYLRNALKDFISWLSLNDYITDELEDMAKQAIVKDKLKDKSYGERSRNYPTFQDLRKIMLYYKNKGLGKFDNFYWYFLFCFLYMSGVRIGELVALKWGAIEKKENITIIHIYDAINHKEKRDNVNRREKAKHYSTKNEQSVRDITAWAYYSAILEDYRISYIYHFHTNLDDMKDMYVFPNINARKAEDRNGFTYQDQKNILRELDRTTKELEMYKLDCQMFRHGCAYFLRDVKHLSAEDAHDYFGHQDSKMIEKVYAKADVQKRRERSDYNLKSLITEKPLPTETEFINIDDNFENREQQKYSTNRRELLQIYRAVSKGQTEYFYDGRFEELIEDMKDIFPQIRFVKM